MENSKNNNKEENEELKLNISIKREHAKRKFAIQLKKKLFMTDNEIESIMEIINAAEEETDTIQDNTNYDNFGLLASENFTIELTKVQKEMYKNVQAKIKEIMDKKLTKAKKYFEQN